MADNVTANPGTGGAVFATDDVSSVHYPITKVAWGALNTATVVEDTSGKRVPVKVSESVLPTGAATDAKQDTMITVLTTISSGIGGGAVVATNIATALITNTTSSAVAVPSGAKTFWGEITGTGAITQTLAIYGARENAAANGLLLCTLTLSGTGRDEDAGAVSMANYPYYYVVSTNTTGTGTSGRVDVFI